MTPTVLPAGPLLSSPQPFAGLHRTCPAPNPTGSKHRKTVSAAKRDWNLVTDFVLTLIFKADVVFVSLADILVKNCYS